MSARYRAVFRCFAGCPGEWALTTPIYRCPTCDGLLDVAHDLDALRDRSAAAWMKLFDERYMRTSWPYGSGVWGKREWVAPEVPDDAIVSTGEGGTNLFWAERLGREIGMEDLWVKQCGNAHSGSFKDLGHDGARERRAPGDRRGGAHVARALLREHRRYVARRSRRTGRRPGCRSRCSCRAGSSRRRSSCSRSRTARRCFALETDFDGCMAIVKELARRGLVYLANSMNPLRIEGQKTVAIEIVQQFDWEVARLGHPAERQPRQRRGALRGVSDDEGARAHRAHARASASRRRERANPMYRAFVAGKDVVEPVVAKKTLASAIQIGNPVSAPRAMAALKAMNGVVEEATEDELADACARADRTGLYTCPHTGVALACLFKLRARGVIRRQRPRRRRLDGERAQVHRVQARVPRADAGGGRRAEGGDAGGAAGGCGEGRRGDRGDVEREEQGGRKRDHPPSSEASSELVSGEFVSATFVSATLVSATLESTTVPVSFVVESATLASCPESDWVASNPLSTPGALVSVPVSSGAAASKFASKAASTPPSEGMKLRSKFAMISHPLAAAASVRASPTAIHARICRFGVMRGRA